MKPSWPIKSRLHQSFTKKVYKLIVASNVYTTRTPRLRERELIKEL